MFKISVVFRPEGLKIHSSPLKSGWRYPHQHILSKSNKKEIYRTSSLITFKHLCAIKNASVNHFIQKCHVANVPNV